jgi:hypothetical protein
MDFGLTEEQQQLKDSARNFLSRECPDARHERAARGARAMLAGS